MKYKRLVCQDCGYEERIETYEREEAEERGLRPLKPKCKKCGSLNIKLYD